MTGVTEVLRAAGQGHVLEALDALGIAERSRSLEPLEGVPIARLSRLAAANEQAAEPFDARGVEPPDWVALPTSPAGEEAYDRARAIGEDLLRAGRVGTILVAGGLGTRLGWDGPKGTFPIGPVTSRSLFQIFAESHLALTRRYGRAIPWAIQTSGANHDETVRFFEDNGYFGVSPRDVRFFSQGTLPAFSPDGTILLDRQGHVVAQPDGHGGVFLALARRGILEWFESRGVEHAFYFQVDNPLCAICDPAFIGLHHERGSQMSTRAVRKTDPGERVGVLARVHGVLQVIEYSELPDALANSRAADGGLTLRAGNTAVHVFTLPFLRAMAQKEDFPVHVARKPVPIADDETVPGIKFEYFVFDALPYAERTLVMECGRETDFAPVKNASGADSPDTARELLSRNCLNMLKKWDQRFRSLPEDEAVEVSPLFALDERDLMARPRPDRLPEPPIVLNEAPHGQ